MIKLPVRMKFTAGGKSIVTLDRRGPEESRLDRALLRAVARASHLFRIPIRRKRKDPHTPEGTAAGRRPMPFLHRAVLVLLPHRHIAIVSDRLHREARRDPQFWRVSPAVTRRARGRRPAESLTPHRLSVAAHVKIRSRARKRDELERDAKALGTSRPQCRSLAIRTTSAVAPMVTE